MHVFTDNLPCSNTSSPDLCVQIEQNTFLVFSIQRTWYQGYNECQKIGASLAILDSKNKIKAMQDFIRRYQMHNVLNMYYVGLTNHEWMPINSSIGNLVYISFTCKKIQHLHVFDMHHVG